MDLSELEFWGPIPQVKVLNVGAVVMGSNPLLLREELGLVSSLLIVCCSSGVEWGSLW